jgi:hypothetical protein
VSFNAFPHVSVPIPDKSRSLLPSRPWAARQGRAADARVAMHLSIVTIGLERWPPQAEAADPATH